MSAPKQLDEILTAIRKRSPGFVAAVPGADDQHTIEAVVRAYKDGVIHPVLIGRRSVIINMLRECNCTQEEVGIIDCSDHGEVAQIAVRMCYEKEAALLVKGGLDSSVFLRPVMSSSGGLRIGKTLSHMTIIEIENYPKLMVVSDGAVIIKPDLPTKKEIIENAVRVMHALGYADDTKVAVLAAVEKVSQKMPETVDAASLKEMNQRGEIKGCIVEGPISFDLAANPSSVEAKHYSSPCAGNSDLFVPPDIAAANILLKALALCGAKSIGFVAGARVPIAMVSRGSTVTNKYNAILFAAATIDDSEARE